MDILAIRSEMKSFLKSYHMDYRDIDFEDEVYKFVEHMEQGLIDDSDLKMIPTYIDPSFSFEYNEPVIAIDAGGTNFRRAVVMITDDDVIIEDLEVFPMPGTEKEMTKEEFFDCIVKFIEPILHRSDKIGFCFSYPVEILQNKDGKVLSLTKELKVKNIENVELGKTLQNHIQKLGIKENKKIIILNDTTSVLLSGVGVAGRNIYETYIGLILGTGTNTCYEELNSNIKKNEELSNKVGFTLINLESGGYSAMPRGLIDEILDNKSMDKGKQLFEKMISGAYLGSVIFETLKAAGEDGNFSKKLINEVKEIESILSKEISIFSSNPYSDKSIIGKILNRHGNEMDRIKIIYIVEDIIERAAKLLAINIKAILVKTNCGRNPSKPVCLTVDGSTFYGSETFQSKFDFYCKLYLENYGYYVKRVKVENGTLIGTAMAALMN